MTRPSDNRQKTENLLNCGPAILADHRVKLKEGETRDKNLDLARELKKLCNMKVTVIPIVINMLGTVTKRLVKRLEKLEIRTQVETIQTIALLRRVLEM